MSALTVTLGADITALKRAMAGATELVAASARRMSAATGAGLAGLGKGGAAALQKGFSLAGTALKASIGGALAGGAAVMAGGVKAVNAAADFESTKVAFTTLIGDAAKAEETLAKLRVLGAKTPFEFPELADAGRKLIAFGEGADTVPETLRRIGDVSAGIQAPVNEIAELYGKARVQGRLFAEDINQLTGRGIPIIGQLARQFGVSDSEVKKLVESGQVGFPAIEQAFIAMTSEGGQFAGMMEAQSKTTKGLFSTLKDTINEVFLALGQPINDAIRPLVEQAIGLVQQLTPMAVEAGKRIKDALMFVLAAFKSGQILDLVASAMKLGFAIGVNALINGFRTAIEFFWNLLTDGAMWKSLGTTLLGLVAGFGAALLNAFQTPIVYLQSGMEWVIASLIKGLLKIPGMSDLLGMNESDVQTDFGKILASRKESGAELFGFNFKELAAKADGLASSGAPDLAGRVAEAARKAGESAPSDIIDTKGLRDNFSNIVQSIRDSMPKEESAKAVQAAGKVAEKAPATPVAPAAGAAKPEQNVRSMVGVGGGGYGKAHGLDAQRENNQLTRETNKLIGQGNAKLDSLAGGGKPASPPKTGTTAEVAAPDNSGKPVVPKQMIAIRGVPPNTPDAGEAAPETSTPAIPKPVSVDVFPEPGKPAIPQPVKVEAAPYSGKPAIPQPVSVEASPEPGGPVIPQPGSVKIVQDLGKPILPQPVSVEAAPDPGKPVIPQPVSVESAPNLDGTGPQVPGGNEETKGVRHAFGRVVQSIRRIMPNAGEATVPGAGVMPPEPTGIPTVRPGLAVEALGKVGGGYANGTLDAQRENNRLTQETNRILREVSRHLATGKPGKLTMAFG